MKYIFSTGEILYKKNIKKLEQGNLEADHIKYDAIAEGSIYEIIGKLDDRLVSVKFKISKSCYQDLSFKNMVKILMQSDLVAANWEEYNISYITQPE